MGAQPFTLEFCADDEHCDAETLVPNALDRIDLSEDTYGEQLDEDEESGVEDDIAVLEGIISECPTDRVEMARGHLHRAAGHSDFVAGRVQEAIDDLDMHGSFCGCAEEAFSDFCEEVARKLDDVGAQYGWAVTVHGGAGPEFEEDFPDVTALLGLTDTSVCPDGARLSIEWTGAVLEVSTRRGAHHASVSRQWQPLTRTQSALESYSGGSYWAGTGGHPTALSWALSVDPAVGDLAAVLLITAAGMGVNDRSWLDPARRGWTSSVDLVDKLTAVRTGRGDAAWTVLTRMVDEVWSGSLEDLLDAVDGVLAQAHTAEVVPA